MFTVLSLSCQPTIDAKWFMFLLLSCGSERGDIHCAKDKLAGALPKNWDWVSLATYDGNTTYKHIVYDRWYYYVRITLLHCCLFIYIYQL